ncbi:MAG TPA: DCC1-like thiol-disulfide oxidoreductase family protein [Longimicrobiales bacterium]
MRRVRESWNRFWFAPSPPLNLGLCRALFFGTLFLFYLPQHFTAWGDVSPVFWEPVFLLRFFHLPQLSAPILGLLEAIWKMALLLCCIGLFTRPSGWTAFLLGAYLFGLQHSFGKVRHHDAILVLSLGLLALSRAGDAFSVDRLIRRARGGPDARPPAPSGEYTWPVRGVWVIMALVFLGAGVSKLQDAGPAWVFSDNMANTLIEANYGITNGPLVPWGLHLAQIGWLTRLMALGALGVELAYPLALFSRRARWLLVPAVLGMQIGIRVILGPRFVQFMICNIFWVPWDRVAARVAARLRAGERYAVLYDGGCGICRRTVAVLERLNALGRLEFLNLHDWAAVQRRFPHLDRKACFDVMHVVTNRGRTRTGFYAYRTLAWGVPAFWPVLPLLYVPGIPAAGRSIYAAVAARRLRGQCALEPATRPQPRAESQGLES